MPDATDPDVGRDRLSRRVFLGSGLLTAAGGVLVLAGCSGETDGSNTDRGAGDGSGDSGSATQSGGKGGKIKPTTLQVGVAAAPTNINPLDSGAQITRWIAEPVMETLYTYDDELNSVPLLADGEPDISADELTWTIKLKKGVTWHNGDPLTADDLVATFKHITTLSSGSEWIVFMLGYVQAWQAIDTHTFEISLAKPYGLLRTVLTNLPIGHAGFTDRRDAMMGTGPFKLDDYNPGQSFTMSAYPGYHGTKPTLKGIVYTVFQDATTRLVSLKQGTVDMITDVPYAHVETAEDDKNLTVYSERAPLDIMWYMNVGQEPFNDENFRKALAYAIDRQGVVDRVYHGQALIGQGPIGPGELGYDPSDKPYGPGPDLAKAKEYLAKATTKVRSFTWNIPTHPVDEKIATVIAAAWKKIGVSVRIQKLSGLPFSQTINGVTYDLLSAEFQSGFTSGPANYTVLSAADPNNLISFGYQNKEVAEATATAWGTSDADERVAALQTINQNLMHHAVMFPPVYPKTIVATRKDVTGFDTKRLRISRLSPAKLTFG